MKQKKRKFPNPVAKYMNHYNKPSTIPTKKDRNRSGYEKYRKNTLDFLEEEEEEDEDDEEEVKEDPSKEPRSRHRRGRRPRNEE